MVEPREEQSIYVTEFFFGVSCIIKDCVDAPYLLSDREVIPRPPISCCTPWINSLLIKVPVRSPISRIDFEVALIFLFHVTEELAWRRHYYLRVISLFVPSPNITEGINRP